MKWMVEPSEDQKEGTLSTQIMAIIVAGIVHIIFVSSSMVRPIALGM